MFAKVLMKMINALYIFLKYTVLVKYMVKYIVIYMVTYG